MESLLRVTINLGFNGNGSEMTQDQNNPAISSSLAFTNILFNNK